MTELTISKQSFDLNFKFYFILKYLVKLHLKQKLVIELSTILSNYYSDISFLHDKLHAFSDTMIKNKDKKKLLEMLILKIENVNDVDIFQFGIKLYVIKDLLLDQAKICNFIQGTVGTTSHLLSTAFDDISAHKPYATRVNGALLSLLFFQCLESGQINHLLMHTNDFMKHLSEEAIKLKGIGLEPNQIFILIFSESMNQSILSDSGSNYEDRIAEVLLKIGVKDFKKIHDENDKSMEFDFFFVLNGRTFGIGAKRTLRERYKQFIKTSHGSHLDVMIQITLGLDLTPEKTKTILGHGTKIFVSDEVYRSRDFLRNSDGVFSVKDFTLETLNSL
jgi:hypothetical protein